jgi:ABC-type protease/lipase transport system fused ATPase/permease subunit
VAAPGGSHAIIRDLSLRLEAGVGMAIIGLSGSGKSTLLRALTGVWPATRGEVLIDDIPLSQWDRDDLGRHVGYLPQDVGLFEGSVIENISRFDQKATAQDVIEAARIAGANDMILRLTNGYYTQIGHGGTILSAGQRQRIGLARAIYNRPFLLALDEPNANLDAEGEHALAEAIRFMRGQGSIVVVVSHRPSALRALDHVAVLAEGRLIYLSPLAEIETALARGGPLQMSCHP